MHFKLPTSSIFYNRELDELFAMIAIRTFATSMIGIFIPIYLLTKGFSLQNIFIFYLINYLVYTITSIPAAHINAKIGFKNSILLSIPFLITFFILLTGISTTNTPLWLIAIISGIHNSLFWISYHTDFTLVSSGENCSKQVGTVNILTQIGRALGPLIGGILITTQGFSTTLIIINILIAVSTIPLFFSKNNYSKIKINTKQALSNRSFKELTAFAAFGMETNIAKVIWPLAIYLLIVSNLETIGLITSISFILSIFVTLTISKIPTSKRQLTLKTGAIFNAIIWVAKTMISTVFQVFAVDITQSITNKAATLSFEAETYDLARKQKVLEFILGRTIAVGIGSAMIFVILIYTNSLISGFYLGALASLLMILI